MTDKGGGGTEGKLGERDSRVEGTVGERDGRAEEDSRVEGDSSVEGQWGGVVDGRFDRTGSGASARSIDRVRGRESAGTRACRI